MKSLIFIFCAVVGAVVLTAIPLWYILQWMFGPKEFTLHPVIFRRLVIEPLMILSAAMVVAVLAAICDLLLNWR